MVVTEGEGAGKGTPRACGRETTWQDWLLRTLLLFVLITYLLLGFFAGCADDYCYASRVRELGVFKGSATTTSPGRAAIRLPPCIFFWSWLMERTDFGLYWLTPILVQSLYLVSLCMLFKTAARCYGLKASPFWLACSFFAVYLSFWGKSGANAIYWAAGAHAYQLPNILLLVLMAILLRTSHSRLSWSRCLGAATSWLLAIAVARAPTSPVSLPCSGS